MEKKDWTLKQRIDVMFIRLKWKWDIYKFMIANKLISIPTAILVGAIIGFAFARDYEMSGKILLYLAVLCYFSNIYKIHVVTKYKHWQQMNLECTSVNICLLALSCPSGFLLHDYLLSLKGNWLTAIVILYVLILYQTVKLCYLWELYARRVR